MTLHTLQLRRVNHLGGIGTVTVGLDAEALAMLTENWDGGVKLDRELQKFFDHWCGMGAEVVHQMEAESKDDE